MSQTVYYTRSEAQRKIAEEKAKVAPPPPQPEKYQPMVYYQRTPEGVKVTGVAMTAEQVESVIFYTELGYPEYAGKYAPFEIKEGQEVAEVKEVTVGPKPPMTVQQALHPPPEKQLVVTLEPVSQQKGLPAGVMVPAARGSQAIERTMYLTPLIPAKKMPSPLTVEQEALVAEVGALTIFTVAMPTILPVTLKGLIISETIAVGVSQTVKGVTIGELLTPREALQAAEMGAVFYTGYAVAQYGATQLTAQYAPQLLSSKLAMAGVRAAAVAPIGAAGGYIISEGKLESALLGAGLAAGFSLGMELVVRPGIAQLRARLPSWLGGVQRLEAGEPTIGKAGEPVETWVSDPLEELGGKRLRIVADVTEKPVGYYGVTTKTLITQYVGYDLPTGHATLKPEAFSLQVGGKTVLVGYPELSAGYRSAQQLYHFYSAPGSEEFVTVYGGYIGIGEGYISDVTPKIVFGGKPTALVTVETPVSAEFLRHPGESESAFLARISRLSGQTGIAPETLLGKSMERQLITPAQYERFGEPLPGSMYVSAGKVGTFQVQQLPVGRLGEIPILRSLLAEYTTIDVYKGAFAPVEGYAATAKALDVPSYAAAYAPTITVPSISIPITAIVPSLLGKPIEQPSEISVSQRVISSQVSVSRYASSAMSEISKVSLPSYPSRVSLPSYPSKVSIPSLPSYPYEPSIPSMPSYPYEPSIPSMPSYPEDSVPPYTPPSPPSYPPPYTPPPPPSYPPSLPLDIFDFKLKPLKLKSRFMQLYGLYLWGYPVAGPKTVLKELGL